MPRLASQPTVCLVFRSLNTQKSGQNITTQDKIVVIWETENKLKFKVGMINTKFRFKLFVRVRDFSPITGAKEPLEVDFFWDDGLSGETCPESRHDR